MVSSSLARNSILSVADSQLQQKSACNGGRVEREELVKFWSYGVEIKVSKIVNRSHTIRSREE